MAIAAGAALWGVLREDVSVQQATNGAVYPSQLPQNATYPAIVWGQLSDDTLDTKDGPINQGYSFQLDIYGKDYVTAQELAQDVKTELQWKTVTVSGLGTCRIVFRDQGDAVPEDEKELIHIVQDYRVRVVSPA